MHFVWKPKWIRLLQNWREFCLIEKWKQHGHCNLLRCQLKQKRVNKNEKKLLTEHLWVFIYSTVSSLFCFYFTAPKSAKTQPKTIVLKKEGSLAYQKPRSTPIQNLELGQVVLCKMRGYSHWPCIVTRMIGNMIKIRFFGDNTTHNTNMKNCLDFSESSEIMKSNLRRLKNTLYKKAVQEAEAVLGISHEHSVLNVLSWPIKLIKCNVFIETNSQKFFVYVIIQRHEFVLSFSIYNDHRY